MSEIVHDEFPRRDNGAQSEGDDPAMAEPSTRFGTSRRRSVPGTTLKSVPAAERVAREGPYEMASEAVPVGDHGPDEAEQRFVDFRDRIAELELRLREQLEIERMRNLELGRLEGELEHKSQRLATVETELFHERRRSAELERRWNDLAARYEEVAASLVETGATLEKISSQTSYRAIVRIVQAVRRHRSTDASVDGVAGRVRPERAG